jgi:hypothetical protein
MNECNVLRLMIHEETKRMLEMSEKRMEGVKVALRSAQLAYCKNECCAPLDGCTATLYVDGTQHSMVCFHPTLP